MLPVSRPGHRSISYGMVCSTPGVSQTALTQMTRVTRSQGDRGDTALCSAGPCCTGHSGAACSSDALLSREERHGALGAIKAHLLLTASATVLGRREHTIQPLSFTSVIAISPFSIQSQVAWIFETGWKWLCKEGHIPLTHHTSLPSSTLPYEFSPFVLWGWTGITQSITSIT